LDDLIGHFSMFKGVGRKTAQRMALETILLSPERVNQFAASLTHTRTHIRFCKACFYLTWGDYCHICKDTRRQRSVICVVSEPKDVLNIDQTGHFDGLFHVLGGVISPLDGIYPEMLRFKELRDRIVATGVRDVILALNPTVEGDTTVLYLKEYLSGVGVSLYQLAQGIPIGADLGYLDEVTIDKAFEGKRLL
jgi:recombination protein RecR